MLRIAVPAVCLLAVVAAPAAAERSAALDGSRASMIRQHSVARESDFTFLRSAAQVRRFVEQGYLVPVEGNADYAIARGVSFPYARPAMRTFIERLAAQYRAGCGERLVVTSLTRPTRNQPRNAHPLSVHPAGMAVDLRVSSQSDCRSWLEETLLSLEAQGLLDVTRERRPPHYHVAVFPEPYTAHVERRLADSLRVAEEERAREEAARQAARRAERTPAASQGEAAVTAPQPQRAGGGGWFSLAAVPLVGGALALRIARRGRTRRDGLE